MLINQSPTLPSLGWRSQSGASLLRIGIVHHRDWFHRFRHGSYRGYPTRLKSYKNDSIKLKQKHNCAHRSHDGKMLNQVPTYLPAERHEHAQHVGSAGDSRAACADHYLRQWVQTGAAGLQHSARVSVKDTQVASHSINYRPQQTHHEHWRLTDRRHIQLVRFCARTLVLASSVHIYADCSQLY